MKILITGSKGFIGKNLIVELKNLKYDTIYEFDIDTSPELLDTYTAECDFVFHLAGINRPQNESEYMDGNFGFASKLLEYLRKHNNKAPVLMTSSIQALLDNPYGRSKKAAEDLFLNYSIETGTLVYVYRLPNVFGKWCRPNYNSMVATFCHNIANGLDIKINDSNANVNLVYIDDVVNEFIAALRGNTTMHGEYCQVPVSYQATVGEIADLIRSFKDSRENGSIPNMYDSLTKKLHSTYLSYLPAEQFSYPLKMNIDNRGSFSEFIKTVNQGQLSVNISKPGITKGNHWHNTKNEKFLVVSGKGVIKFRRIDNNEVIEYCVSGDKLEVIDIPPGYTHSITNLGDTDMVTIMWANECFDPDKPDTYFQEVI
jgi:UDP-2-acetamido-2,6-beta-L-arabino-hexul-4-ose reductase